MKQCWRSNLSVKTVKLNKNTKPIDFDEKGEKTDTLEILNTFYEAREIILNPFDSGLFWLRPTKDTRRPSDLASLLKILTPKQISQKLTHLLH